MPGSPAGRFVAWLLCPALAVGQAAPPSATFQITSRIVYVDVVVRDRSGQIVRGLTEKDFRVLEDGKDQKIDYFHDHTHDPAPAAAAGAHQGEFSNVAPGGEASNSVNIVLFDFFNTAPQDYLYARKQMILFLEKLPPGRQTTLFVLGTRLEMVQGFTGSTDRLVAARAMQLGTSTVETVGEQQQDGDLAAALSAATGRSPSGTSALAQMFTQAHGQDEIRAHDITQTALDQLAAAVSGYPGRKNLYWLGETFPVYGGPVLELNDAAQSMIDNTMSTQDMAEANRAEASAQIAIYPISLMGLDASGMGPEAAGMTSTQTLFTQRNAMHEMLNNLADATGGQAYYGTNDFAGALARGFEDGSNYYSLAYRPANHNWNGHYRNIAVKLAERGYSLSYRRGYFAVPDQPTLAANAGAVMTAALQPDTPEETMLRLKAKVELPDAAHPAVRVDSVIDPGNVSFQTDERGRRHARLLVTLEALPDPAPGAKTAGKDAPRQPPQESGMYVVNLDEAAFQKLLAAGMPAHQEMNLAPGRYRLRLGVCDLSNLRVGTLDMPVEIGSTAPTGR